MKSRSGSQRRTGSWRAGGFFPFPLCKVAWQNQGRGTLEFNMFGWPCTLQQECKAPPHSPSAIAVGSTGLQQPSTQFLEVEEQQPSDLVCSTPSNVTPITVGKGKGLRRKLVRPCRYLDQDAEQSSQFRAVPLVTGLAGPLQVQDGEEEGCGEKHCSSWSEPRASSETFFPMLEGTSLRAEAQERRQREMEQEESLRSLEEMQEARLIHNAAVPPDWRPSPQPSPRGPSGSSAEGSPTLDESLRIHGLSVEDYRQLYHAVAEPLLLEDAGRPHDYSLELGRGIKQRLWQSLQCPTLTSTEQADGFQVITESFTVGMKIPQVDLDVSDEPD